MLQTTHCDDRNSLGRSKGRLVLQEPIDRSDDTRFACSAVWSWVRRSASISMITQRRSPQPNEVKFVLGWSV